MLEVLARQFLYRPPALPVPSPPPPPLEEVWLDLATGDRALAWTSADPMPPGAPVVLFFHGNSENLETMRMAGLCQRLEGVGVAFLAVDYPGYGRSSGEPSEKGLLATGAAAVDWARQRQPGRPVVACGWSMGAAVAIATAAAHPGEVGGLVALCPWTRLEDVVRRYAPELPAAFPIAHRYDSLAAARKVRAPALVIHGELDPVIPVEQGRQIARALGGPSRFIPIPGARHRDLLVAHPQVWRDLSGFFASLRAEPS